MPPWGDAAGLKSVTFVACDDVAGAKLERFGEQLAQECYYRANLGGPDFPLTFWFTADGRIAGMMPSYY